MRLFHDVSLTSYELYIYTCPFITVFMAITIFINGIGHESGAVFGDPPAGHHREMVSTNHVW